MVGQRVGYTRVSSADHNTARQLDGVTLDRTFSDHASGKDTNRPQLQAALAFIREGDTLVCHSMDRLARNLDDLRRIVTELTKRGVSVEFVKEHLTFTGTDSPMANLPLSVMGAFAQFERELIKERQREGIAVTKAKGTVYCGRVPSLTPEKGRAVAAPDGHRGVQCKTRERIRHQSRIAIQRCRCNDYWCGFLSTFVALSSDRRTFTSIRVSSLFGLDECIGDNAPIDADEARLNVRPADKIGSFPRTVRKRMVKSAKMIGHSVKRFSERTIDMSCGPPYMTCSRRNLRNYRII